MKLREIFDQYILPVIAIIALVMLWQIFSVGLNIPVWLLPAPTRIVSELAQWWRVLPGHIWVTLYETLAGFFLAIIIGVPLAVLIISSKFLQNTIYPILVVTQSVPKVAIAPILLIWVGYGILPKILIAFLVAFFPIVVNMATGLTVVEQDLLDLVKVLSASPLQVLVKIRFPSAMPHFFAGLKIAIALAVIGAVIGEFVGADKGLGYLIVMSSSHMNTSLSFGAMAILAIMGVALFGAVAGLERLLCPWYTEER